MYKRQVQGKAFIRSGGDRVNDVDVKVKVRLLDLQQRQRHHHLSFVPLTADGRLSAKEIVGNKKKLTQWQDKFWEYMVLKYPDLEMCIRDSQKSFPF